MECRMDDKDASAMTEASGMIDDASTPESMVPPEPDAPRVPPEKLGRLTDVLRSVTRSAPLSSLLAAFVLGILVARRH
jgi:hypothetical protein